MAEFTLYSANGVVDGAVEPGAPVTAELILTNTPDRDREVVFYAAAAGADGRVLDVMERKNVIKAGTATQLQIPISFAGIPAERYRVSVYLWDGMRPLAEKRGYTAEE